MLNNKKYINMENSISKKVKEIIKKSLEIVEDNNYKLCTPEVLVLTILKDDSNTVVNNLQKFGVNIDDVINDLHNYIENKDYKIIYKDNNNKYSPTTKRVLGTSKQIKKNVKDNKNIVDLNAVFLSILKVSGIDLINLLNKHNINFNKYNNLIMNEENYSGDYDNSFSNDGESSKPKNSQSKSKTPILDNFCVDVTKMAKEGEIDPVIGRDEEIKRVAIILSHKKKSNPVLIGEPGVGKTSIVDGLALNISEKKVPRVLLDKRILSLNLGSLVAGTKYRGQFEERMKAIIEELTNNKDIILFIDELHTIVGTGNSAGSLDASNMFKPALARGEIKVIGATTLNEFREKIETDGALTRRFQQVMVDEPNFQETLTILKHVKPSFEKHHKVNYSDDAILECVKLADRYITDRANPDKSLDVLDSVGASANLEIEVPKAIKNLEKEIDTLIEDKKTAVKQQNYENAAELRDREQKTEKKLEIAKENWRIELNEKRTLVTDDMVADTVSLITGIPVNKLSIKETKKLKNMDKELCGKVIGQDDAIFKVSKAIKRNRIGIKSKNSPIGSFIFLGPTGVGKTFTAKLLADYVFGSEENLIRFDMSEFMERHTISRLIGSPPGYVGYEEGGKLTEAVRRKPYSVILLDEIEKAHKDVFNLLLQVLDEGHLTDSLGRKVDFKNTLIIMTSNIGVKELQNRGGSFGFASLSDEELSQKDQSILTKALKSKFAPEFLNRLDDTIVFNSLTKENIDKIIVADLNNVRKNVNVEGYDLVVEKSMRDFLSNEGYQPEYGARPLSRVITKYIEDVMTDEILDGNLEKGGTIKFSHSKTNGVKTTITNKKEKTT